MKRAGLVIVVLACLGCAHSLRDPPAELAGAPGVAWLGLDYSLVRMIGTGDFRDPDQIFPGYLNGWNELFSAEMLPEARSVLGKPVRVDLAGVYANNSKATPAQVIRDEGPGLSIADTHIGPADIEQLVKGYPLSVEAPIGLVFVIDRLVKPSETGCLYTVFFDTASRSVLKVNRTCQLAAGFGFRNYWFNPIKEALRQL